MPDFTALWEHIKPYWDRLNDFLSIPVVQVFGRAIIVIALAKLALLIKSVRQWLANFVDRVRDRIFMARLYPALGIASTKELSELREELNSARKKTPNDAKDEKG